MRLLALATLGLAALALTAAAPPSAEVTIDNFAFSPATITIAANTTLTWRNRDDIPHLVASASGPAAFRSPALDTDQSYAFTFRAPGVYKYFCALHPHMQGSVVVR